ncbi:multidrug efflux system CmeABC transcriptional regulator, TetR family [Campylobacter blaseri]|uniref:TetR/AcrR family transcriptional regulator n=1 Tax=Campylobacter blaseri TaxID=2042961 RepID=UPI0012FFE4C2|nr:TetR/AcrR family transcriptional regulator [Campylobacter blaseri]QKF85336.1 multidrug efflux system CmeABC transcriptional regulator, TetR family [Campylobacter blaseri]
MAHSNSFKTKDRFKKIVNSASELFLQNGYKKTSLNDIVEKSGGSLSTIYEYFGNKEGLFKAIIINGIENFTQDIEENIKVDSNLNLEEYLFKFGQIYLTLVLSKNSILFHRLILNEAFLQKNSNMRNIFCSKLSEFKEKNLVEFFKKDEKIGKFSEEELGKIASNFLNLIREPYFFNALFYDENIEINKKELDQHLKKYIKIFLYGILK